MTLKDYLMVLVERQGSDLHLVAGAPATIRINGVLSPLEDDSTPLEKDAVGKLIEPFLSDAQNEALRNRQDVYTSVVVSDSLRFRTCVFWDRHGLGASFRLIPTIIPTMSHLFSPETETTFRGLVNRRRGLTLVVGMTGSGKSTAVASMIDTINSERRERIFTIEDPIEYTLSNKLSLISQREVGTDVDSYEQGGISAMRSDSDVVLLGELRTPEAVRIALIQAEIGYLVFATMHADSVSEAVRRLIDSAPESRETMQSMLARTLNAVIRQRLVPCGDRPGRVPAHEIMIVNSRIRRMIVDGETDLSVAIEAGRDEGMRSMDDSLLDLYHSGTINYDMAWQYVQDRERLGPRPVAAGDKADA